MCPLFNSATMSSLKCSSCFQSRVKGNCSPFRNNRADYESTATEFRGIEPHIYSHTEAGN